MDRFDDIWKNRFNDGNTPIGDWNSPDDELVWEGIAQHIPTKNKRRKVLWWWWVIGALITLGLLFSFISMSKNSINQNNLSTSEIILPIKKDSNNLVSNNNISTNSTSISSNQKKSEGSQTIAREVEKSDFNLSATHYANSTLSAVSLEQQEILEEEKTEIKINENTEIKRIQNLNLTDFEISENIDFNIPELDLNNQNNPFLLNFNVGVVFWEHQISNQYISDLSAFEFNYSDDFGWQSSLSIEYVLNKHWSFFGGIQYEQVETFSGHNSPLTYDLNTEQNQSNDYAQALATPYGLSEASFRFNRNESIGDDEVDLLVDFKSRHLIQNWSLPLGISYSPIGQKNRFKPSINVGFGVNYLSNISNSIHQIKTHHSAIHFENGVSSFAKPNLNKWHYDIRMGLALNYQLIPNLGIQFQYNWTKGLNPVFQQEKYETKINRHHWSLGIRKTFGPN